MQRRIASRYGLDGLDEFDTGQAPRARSSRANLRMMLHYVAIDQQVVFHMFRYVPKAKLLCFS